MFLLSRCNRIGIGLLTVFGFAFLTFSANGQEKETIELKLYARGVPELVDSVRLLPVQNELRKGNAAVVYLRMPWEQRNFMNSYPAKLKGWMDLDYNAPEVIEAEGVFEHFVQQMRRAAYMEDAEWEYPIGEEPIVSILLPDVQGMRQFMGRVLGLWVGVQIERGDLENAREGILIQFASAIHLCRTPFGVTNLIGVSITDIAFDRFQILIQQKQAENFYYALGLLPETLGDMAEIFELEASFLEGSLPSLTTPYPPIGDPAWNKAAKEFSAVASMLSRDPISPYDGAAFYLRMLFHSQTALLEMGEFSEEQIKKMGKDEIIGRWILAQAKQFNSRRLASTLLPLPEQIQELIEIEKQVKALQEQLKAPATPFASIGVEAFVGLHRFNRKARLHQVIEAIRDYASKHDNQLPDSLDDIELFVPLDSLTGKPFNYKLEGDKATLSAADIPNVADAVNNRFPVFRLEIIKE